MKTKTKKIIILLCCFSWLLSACSVSKQETLSPSATVPVTTEIRPTQQDTQVQEYHYYQKELRIPAGDQSLLFGDYEEAQRIFSDAFATADNEEKRAASLFGLGLIYYKSEETSLSLNTFEELISSYPDSIHTHRAFYLLGEIYHALERDEEALMAYSNYLSKREGILDVYVLEKVGDIQAGIGKLNEAIESYQSAYLASNPGEEQQLGIKIASTYDNLDEDETALSLYQNIYFNTGNSYTKAQMDLLMGRIHYENGETELAYSYYQDAVNNYPESYDSYSALVTLVNDGVQVNEFQRGLINFNIGQYNLAIDAFDRYMTDSQADIAAGLYYKALATRAMGLERANIISSERLEANKTGGTSFDQEAIALWNKILLEHPTSVYYVDAVEDIAYTHYAYMNDPEKAAQVTINYVASVPNSPWASSFLFDAGRYYEIAGMLKEAADTWVRLGNEYPSSSETFQGLFFAGMLYYRLNESENAKMAFNKALVLSLEPLETAGAHLWLGIVKRDSGKMDDAKISWQAAKSSDPNGYYGLRAQELLEGKEIFSSTRKYNFEIDWGKERAHAENWLRENFTVPNEVDLHNLGELSLDEQFIRGYEYWSLGLYEKGRIEFEKLRGNYQSDPVKSYQLMHLLIELGYYRSVIDSSRNIIKLTGSNEYQENVPKYFKLLIYGPYYKEWIVPISEKYQIDPLLLFSLIHQESHFEGYVSSSAGARGLMQIMPATGEQIANEMDWPKNFTNEDLDIPYVSLTLGTNYLARQLSAFEGDIYAALAAYNGGPGNALTWKKASGDDPDLFLGSVRFLETRTYIRSIVENFTQYLLLYSSY